MRLLPQLAAAALTLAALAQAPAARAQVNININPAPTAPPPVVVAPASTQYYYIPELNGYYDLSAQRYVVLQNGQWVRVANLGGYNPATFHPVVIDYRGATPWVFIDKHRGKGHPHGMPPGQAKKMARSGGVIVVPGAPVYRDRDDDDRDDRDDDRGGRGKGHGKGRGKDRDKD